jgi:hypothetical protein
VNKELELELARRATNVNYTVSGLILVILFRLFGLLLPNTLLDYLAF